MVRYEVYAERADGSEVVCYPFAGNKASCPDALAHAFKCVSEAQQDPPVWRRVQLHVAGAVYPIFAYDPFGCAVEQLCY